MPRQKHVECVFDVWVDLEKKAVLDTGVEVSTKYVRHVRAKGSYEKQETFHSMCLKCKCISKRERKQPSGDSLIIHQDFYP